MICQMQTKPGIWLSCPIKAKSRLAAVELLSGLQWAAVELLARFVCIFAKGKNYSSNQFVNWLQPQSTGLWLLWSSNLA